MPSVDLAPDRAALGPRGSLACSSGGGTGLVLQIRAPRQGRSPRWPAWRGARRSGCCRARHRGRYRPPAQHKKPGNRLLKVIKARSDPIAPPFSPDHHPLLTGSVIHKTAPARGKPHLHPLCTRRLLSGGIRPMPRLAPVTRKPSLPTRLCRALARKGRASAGSSSIAGPASRRGTTGRGVGAAFSSIGLPHCVTRPRACVMRRHLSRSIRPGVCRNGIACK